MESKLPDAGPGVDSFSGKATLAASLSPANQGTLERMVTILDFAEGFTLLFAQCNLPVLRWQLIDVAQGRLAALGIEVVEIECDRPVRNLRQLLRERLLHRTTNHRLISAPDTAILQLQEPLLTYPAPKVVLFVTGLEQSIPYNDPAASLLAELNLGRELFQRELPHPILFWLPDYALTAVARHAPDFWAWRSGVFEFESDDTLRSQAISQIVRREGGWPTVSNLSPEEKQHRLRLLETLFDDYVRLPTTAAVQAELADVLFGLGEIHQALYNVPQAIRYYEQALEFYRKINNLSNAGRTLNNIGGVYDDLGDKPQALAYYEQALPLVRQVGNRAGEAATLNNIGLVYSALGDKPQALAYYEQALPLRRQVGDRWGESVTRFNLAMVYRDLGRLAEAEAQLQQVVAIDEAVGHPDLESDRAMLRQVQARRAQRSA
jgi:tetratricopeptide (TPR) repeat protein